MVSKWTFIHGQHGLLKNLFKEPRSTFNSQESRNMYIYISPVQGAPCVQMHQGYYNSVVRLWQTVTKSKLLNYLTFAMKTWSATRNGRTFSPSTRLCSIFLSSYIIYIIYIECIKLFVKFHLPDGKSATTGFGPRKMYERYRAAKKERERERESNTELILKYSKQECKPRSAHIGNRIIRALVYSETLAFRFLRSVTFAR